MTTGTSRLPRQTLVTGGAGFIGSHLVACLLQAGHHVVLLENFSTGRAENLATVQGHSRLELEHPRHYNIRWFESLGETHRETRGEGSPFDC